MLRALWKNEQDEAHEPECQHVIMLTDKIHTYHIFIHFLDTCGTRLLDTWDSVGHSDLTRLFDTFCRLLWETLTWQLCKTLLLNTLSWHFGRTLLLDTFVRRSYLTLLLDALTWNFLQDTLTWHSCGTLLLDTFVGQSGFTRLLDTFVGAPDAFAHGRAVASTRTTRLPKLKREPSLGIR